MLVGQTIDDELSAPEVAAIIGAILVTHAQQNRLLMRRGGIPPLYSSGVRYQVEPWAGTMQSLRTCREALREGWAECKSLSAWLLAQYREQAPDEFTASQYDIDVTWTDKPADPLGIGLVPHHGIVRIFHARVLHPSGKIEDPSRKLRRR
jgi:hypothetical protein